MLHKWKAGALHSIVTFVFPSPSQQFHVAVSFLVIVFEFGLSTGLSGLATGRLPAGCEEMFGKSGLSKGSPIGLTLLGNLSYEKYASATISILPDVQVRFLS